MAKIRARVRSVSTVWNNGKGKSMIYSVNFMSSMLLLDMKKKRSKKNHVAFIINKLTQSAANSDIYTHTVEPLELQIQ